MAGFEDKLKAIRNSGASDADVWEAIKDSPQVKGLLSKGQSPEDIQSAIGLNLTPAGAESSNGVLSSLGHYAGLVGGSLAQGAASVIGLPGDVEQLGNKYLPNYLTRPLGSAPGTPPEQNFPTGADMRQALGVLGGPAPQNQGEAYLSAAMQGVGAALPAALTGGLSALPELAAAGGEGLLGIAGSTLAKEAPLAIAGAAGGLGGELGNQIAPDQPLAALGLGIGASLLAGGGTDAAKKFLNDVQLRGFNLQSLSLNNSVSALKDRLADAKSEATKHSLAFEKAQIGRIKADNELKTAAVAQANDAISAAQQTTQSTLDNISQSLGPAKNMEQVGTPLQTNLRNWMRDEVPGLQDSIMAPVKTAIPQTTQVGSTNLSKAYSDINSDAGEYEGMSQIFKSNAPVRAQAELKALLAAQGMGLKPPTTWQGAANFRTTIGDAIRNPSLVNTIGEGNLRRIYNAVSDDMTEAASKISPEALATWQDANKKYTDLMDFINGPVSDVISTTRASAEDKNPITVAQKILKSGSANIARLRAVAPKEMDNLAAATIAKGKWQGLEPDAQAALIPDPAVRSALDTAYSTNDTLVAQANKTKSDTISQSANNLAAKRIEYNLAKNARGETINQLEDMVRAAQKRADAMAERVAEAKSRSTTTGRNPFAAEDMLRTLLGTGVGGALGMLLPHIPQLAGGLVPEVTGPAMALAGTALPNALRLGRAVNNNPSLILNPIVGGVAAKNAPQTPQK